MRYCPNCGTEYVETVTRCADCDRLLIDETAWHAMLAEREAENREEFVTLATVQDRFEADVLSDLLKKEGVPVLIQKYGDTSFDGIFIPQKGWGVLRVPREKLVRAERLVLEYKRQQPEDEGTR